MKLMFKHEFVGEINTYAPDDENWMVGNIELTSLAETLRSFLESLTDDEPDFEIKQFPTEYWDERNWTILVEGDNEREIEIPAVHFDDSSIYWLWR